MRPVTIGFFNASLKADWSQRPWRAMQTKAQELGARLLYFNCDQLQKPHALSTPQNIITGLASAETVDALIVWKDTIGIFLSDEQFNGFLDRFPVPKVIIEGQVPGCATLLFDSQLGMYQLCEHLLRHHGRTRLAFLGFVEKHEGYQKQYAAFVSAHLDAGITIDPTLVKPFIDLETDFANASLQDSIRVDWLRQVIDAGAQGLVCVTDVLAAYCLEGLERLGVQVPQDFALVSMGGTNVGFCQSTALTSVKPHWEEMGLQALLAALAVARGGSVPDIIHVPETLIIRQSCGCPPTCLDFARSCPASATAELLRDALARQARELALAPDQAERLADAWLAADDPEGSGFLDCWTAILTERQRWTADLSCLQNLLSLLERYAGPVSFENRLRVISQARILVSSHGEHAQKFQLNQHEAFLARQARLFDALRYFLGLEQLKEVLASHLPGLGIDSWDLVLYQDLSPYRFGETMRSPSRLMLAHHQGQDWPLPEDGEVFESQLLIPAAMPLFAPGSSWVITALHFEDLQLGYIVFQASTTTHPEYEAITRQIAKALHGNRLVIEAIERSRQLQASLDHLHDTQEQLIISEKMVAVGSLVRGLSHEMNTPIGTIITAGSFLADRIAQGKRSIGTGNADPKTVQLWMDDIAEATELIQRSAGRATSLIQKIRQVSGDSFADPKRHFPIKSYFTELVENFCQAHSDMDLVIELSGPDELQIEGSPGLYAHILVNLLNNSITHGFKCRDGGQIFIHLDLSPAGYLEWRYQDNGCGVDPDNIKHLFEPFHANMQRTEHSGLGTFIIYSLVTQHLGGTIAASNLPAGGLAYELRIPLSFAAQVNIQTGTD